MSNGKSYELEINETAIIKGGWLTRTFIVFAGMPNEKTYSLAISYTNCHNSVAYNLFIPTSQTEVKLFKGRLLVTRVTPTRISFSVQGREKSVGRAPL
jgi:hypothetical protein